jgi:hypothetical protein
MGQNLGTGEASVHMGSATPSLLRIHTWDEASPESSSRREGKGKQCQALESKDSIPSS